MKVALCRSFSFRSAYRNDGLDEQGHPLGRHRTSSSRHFHQPLAGTVRALTAFAATTPSAYFCRPARVDRSILSLDSETNSRSPEVSSTAFRTQPPDLQPVLLMDMDFVVNCQLVQHRTPQIRFLYIGSRICSTLLSDPVSRRCPCASL